jgi:hypothetical protein
MRLRLFAAFAAVAVAYPAQAQSDLELGFAGALRGCEAWVLDPPSWSNGPEPFRTKAGLGDKMGLVSAIDEAALPPAQLRVGNHYWQINSSTESGYILVVSDQLPMCHIKGGGQSDLEPAIETVLSSSHFESRWERGSDRMQGEIISTTFKNREEAKLSMTINRANKPGLRRDRVQVVATAVFEVSQ